MKAANQLIVAGTIGRVAEAIVFLEAHGVSATTALEVLRGGLAGSTVLDRKGATMVARDFKPGFRLELHHKDMEIVADAAREAGVAILIGSLAVQLVACAQARGDGALDHSALLRLAVDLSGRGEAPPARPGE